MIDNTNFGRNVLIVVAWVVAVLLGLGLIWYAFLRPTNEKTTTAQPSATTLIVKTSSPPPTTATATSDLATLAPTATTVPVTAPPALTNTPPASVTPQASATATPEPSAEPGITTGADGVNVRSGPGTNYSVLGFLSPNTQAPVTGHFGGWWQILYENAPGWVFADIVTASDVDNVPQVQPPPSPAPAPVTPVPTAPPATATTAPSSNTRGLVVDGYQVEGAPGPFAVGQEIWFNIWVTNTSDQEVEFIAMGTWIQENNVFQKSFVYSSILPHAQFTHRDHLYAEQLPAAGGYTLWLRICFDDGVCTNLAGPVPITVQ